MVGQDARGRRSVKYTTRFPKFRCAAVKFFIMVVGSTPRSPLLMAGSVNQLSAGASSIDFVYLVKCECISNSPLSNIVFLMPGHRLSRWSISIIWCSPTVSYMQDNRPPLDSINAIENPNDQDLADYLAGYGVLM